MRRKRSLPWLLTVLCVSACGDGSERSSDSAPSLKLTIVGQALIEHDPRAYLETPLQSVAPILGEADVVFTNLEVAIAGPSCACEPTRTDVFFHGAETDVLDYLRDLGVSLLSLSNNHAWDYGTAGVLSTIAEATARGFTHAGTGVSVSA